MKFSQAISGGILLLLTLGFVGACSENSSKKDVTESTVESPADLIPTGDLTDNNIIYQFAIYYLPRPTKEPLAELDLLLKRTFADFQRVEKIEKEPKGLTLAARIEANPKKEYTPPDLKSLQYFGRGVSHEQAEALQETETALILDFGYPKTQVWNGYRSALELTLALARSTDGVIWDAETREAFSPDSWEQRRIKDWNETIPDVTKQIVIHAYKKDDFVRAITLGMAKVGLPDVVIDNFSWSLNRNMGHIVNMFAQAIAEGATLKSPGEFDLDMRSIKNPQVREPQVTTLKPNATGVARLLLKKGTWEDGDPRNRIIEISFERGEGSDIHAKQVHVVGQAFGWEDAAKPVKHNEELEAASRQARIKLPALREEFNNGLGPGEFIEVKAPFARPDAGHEFMWVEVTTWNGDKITGLLKNEPFSIPTLHAGQVVEVSEAKVFDYIRRHADGTSEGNETGKVIEKQSQ